MEPYRTKAAVASRPPQDSLRVAGVGTTRTRALLVVLAVVAVSAATLMTGNEQEPLGAEQRRLSYPGYQVPQLEAALLVARAPVASSFHRNPFAYDQPQVAAAPDRPPHRVPPQPTAPPPSAPAAIPETERSQSFPWQYLGYLGPEQSLVAVFRSTGHEVEVAAIGQVIAGGFRLQAITPESVQLATLEQPEELITVPLAKN